MRVVLVGADDNSTFFSFFFIRGDGGGARARAGVESWLVARVVGVGGGGGKMNVEMWPSAANPQNLQNSLASMAPACCRSRHRGYGQQGMDRKTGVCV